MNHEEITQPWFCRERLSGTEAPLASAIVGSENRSYHFSFGYWLVTGNEPFYSKADHKFLGLVRLLLLHRWALTVTRPNQK